MVKCPICESTFDVFAPYGRNNLPNRCCPKCKSVERHRTLWLLLERKGFLSKERNIKLLDIAPTKGLSEKIREFKNIEYISIDLQSPLAMYKMDIQDLQFDDSEFDIIICYHVLEHVEDDFKAMREIYRVLKPGGIVLFQVPIRHGKYETIEGKHIDDPDERRQLFGQEDHMRYYGLDFKDKLERAGFVVEVLGIKNFFSKNEINLYKLCENDIYIASKPHRSIIHKRINEFKYEINYIQFIDIHNNPHLIDVQHEHEVPIKKSYGMAIWYKNFFEDKRIKNLFELGIAEGGSCVLFHTLFDLDTYVGVDIKYSEKAIKTIDYLGLKNKTNFYFNVSQDNRSELKQIIEKHFPEGIDLVVDDASHIFEPALSSFEIAFPYLRSYGYYVIEDWGWSHWAGFENHPFNVNKLGSLTNLVILLIMALASNPNLIRKIYFISSSLIVIQKGNQKIKESEQFSLKNIIRINEPDGLILLNLDRLQHLKERIVFRK